MKQPMKQLKISEHTRKSHHSRILWTFELLLLDQISM